jgi:hypothetical protein
LFERGKVEQTSTPRRKSSNPGCGSQKNGFLALVTLRQILQK